MITTNLKLKLHPRISLIISAIILNQIKFNLITLNWKTKICALGGISYKNVMLINLTKSTSIGIKSLIAKKKPVHN